MRRDAVDFRRGDASVLRNPLASSYTLGVSSGASLGAAFVLLLGVQLPLIPTMTLPAAGFVLGLAAVLAAMGLSARFDADMRSGTIILTGMVLSLFINAIITLLCALKKEYLNQLVFWQMGSFSGGSMKQNAVLLAVLAVCVPLLLRLSAEMDILTFGDDLAATSGFSPRKVRGKLIVLSTLLTGTAVSFCGTIGFVDLIVPHLARKLFGARHRWLIPASAVLGGCADGFVGFGGADGAKPEGAARRRGDGVDWRTVFCVCLLLSKEGRACA